MNNFLPKFNYIFVAYFFMVITFPGSGAAGLVNNSIAFLLTILFALTVNFAFILNRVRYLTPVNSLFSCNKVMIKVFSFVASVGLMFYIYDRVFILGVDYSSGIASVRYQLTEIAESTNTKSYNSIYSLLGNLFIPFSFWNLIFIFKAPDLSRRFLIVFSSINLLVVVVSSLLYGGRTNIMLLLLIVLLVRKANTSRVKGTQLRTLYTFSGLIALFFIIGYVFYDRATTNKILMGDYLVSMVEFLRGSFSPAFHQMLDEVNAFLSTLVAVFFMIVAYFIHSFWVFASIVDTNNEGVVVGYNYYVIFNKFGLASYPKDPSIAGLFLSLPGGIFYNYGWFGFFLFLLVLVLQAKLLNIMSRMHGIIYNIGFVLFVAVLVVLFASPFIILFDIYMFPGFLVTGLFMSLFMKKRTWQSV